jgi:hypothetical protein
MGFFRKSLEELNAEYRQFMSELVQLTGQIQYHQQLSQKEMASGDIKRFAQGAKESQRAQFLINQAKKVAAELKTVCEKLRKPIPDVVRFLLGETTQEKKLVKEARGTRA